MLSNLNLRSKECKREEAGRILTRRSEVGEGTSVDELRTDGDEQ